MRAELLDKLAQISPEEERLLAGGSLDMQLYTDRLDFVIDSDKMLLDGQLITMRPHTRFVDFPTHRHNFVEVMYMCSGTTTHRINNLIEVTLQEGELLFMNQHVTQAIKRAGEGDVAVNFLALPAFFDFALEQAGGDNAMGKFIISTLQQKHSESSFLHFKVADVWQVQNLVENLIGILLAERNPDHRASKITMGLLMLELQRHADRLTTAPGNHRKMMVAEALQEVHDHYNSPNLSAIAARHKVSLAYVSVVIKEETGKNFTDHLQEKRMELAMDYLCNTKMAIEDILYTVGYSNSSYFYKLFKRIYNETPFDFRKRLRSGKKH